MRRYFLLALLIVIILFNATFASSVQAFGISSVIGEIRDSVPNSLSDIKDSLIAGVGEVFNSIVCKIFSVNCGLNIIINTPPEPFDQDNSYKVDDTQQNTYSYPEIDLPTQTINTSPNSDSNQNYDKKNFTYITNTYPTTYIQSSGLTQEVRDFIQAHVSRQADSTSKSVSRAKNNPSGNASLTTLTVTGSATSTFANGIDITDGCFAVDGVCLSASGGSGTVTSVAMTVPTGLSISGSPITTSGTLALTLTSGYTIPLTASTTQWDLAYASTTNLVSSQWTTSGSDIYYNQAGTVLIPNGTALDPSIGFFNDSSTGIFRPTSGAIGFTTSGSERMRIDTLGKVGIGTGSGSITSQLTIGTGQIEIPSGSPASAPGYSFGGDLNTGIYSSGADTINFSTGGSETARFTSSGLAVGVGSSPSAKLHLLGISNLFRAGYDSSNYFNADVSSTGVTTFDAVGSSHSFSFSDKTTVTDGTRSVVMADGTYSVNATGQALFTGTGLASNPTATLVNGTYAGLFTKNDGTAALFSTDGTRVVNLSDGTYAINATGGSQFVHYNQANTYVKLSQNNDAIEAFNDSGTSAVIGGSNSAGYFEYGSDNVTILDGSSYSINTNGDISAASYFGDGSNLTGVSDQRLKHDINSLDATSTLDKIMQLNAVSFKYNKDDSETTRYGYVAQEVQNIFPSLVETNEKTGFMSLRYTDFTGILTSGIQEIYKKVQVIESTLIDFGNYFADKVANIKEAVVGTLRVNDKVCVDDVCVTKEQFKDLLINAGGVGASQESNNYSSSDNDSNSNSNSDANNDSPSDSSSDTATSTDSTSDTNSASSTPDNSSISDTGTSSESEPSSESTDSPIE